MSSLGLSRSGQTGHAEYQHRQQHRLSSIIGDRPSQLATVAPDFDVGVRPAITGAVPASSRLQPGHRGLARCPSSASRKTCISRTEAMEIRQLSRPREERLCHLSCLEGLVTGYCFGGDGHHLFNRGGEPWVVLCPRQDDTGSGDGWFTATQLFGFLYQSADVVYYSAPWLRCGTRPSSPRYASSGIRGSHPTSVYGPMVFSFQAWPSLPAYCWWTLSAALRISVLCLTRQQRRYPAFAY